MVKENNNEIFLIDYMRKVDTLTMKNSKDLSSLKERLEYLDGILDISRLLTSLIGLSGETGEFSDIVKKIVFHNKELDEEILDNLEKELGDIMWYWINACKSLKLDPYEVINNNIKKLSERYPHLINS